MQSIYTYIPETNYVPREYSVAAVLLLLFMVLISLVPVFIIIIIIIIISQAIAQYVWLCIVYWIVHVAIGFFFLTLNLPERCCLHTQANDHFTNSTL